MTIEVITKDDLHNLKIEIINEIKKAFTGETKQKKWLKSADV